jgi:L-lactate dehydrogenase complex protein LldG
MDHDARPSRLAGSDISRLVGVSAEGETVSDARQQILDRIRRATNGESSAATSALQRNYIQRGQLNTTARVELMIERLREYDAEVVECLPEDLAACAADQLTSSGLKTFVAPPGLPAEWLAKQFTWKVDHGLTHAEIETCDGVVTACFAGVADSGTIVLHHSASEGRRVLTLLPDWHLCVLRASQIVETLPEYFARCPEPPALATYISGPSATADIEMTRIKGVHGPRFLHVIIVHDETPSQPNTNPS